MAVDDEIGDQQFTRDDARLMNGSADDAGENSVHVLRIVRRETAGSECPKGFT